MRRNLFKVVRAKDRTSAIVGGLKKYSLKYLKSFETKAIPGTVGIFCFTTKTAAERFREMGDGKEYEIIQVAPLGKRIKVRFISDAWDTRSMDKYYKNPNGKNVDIMLIPDYTVCYPSVIVLE